MTLLYNFHDNFFFRNDLLESGSLSVYRRGGDTLAFDPVGNQDPEFRKKIVLGKRNIEGSRITGLCKSERIYLEEISLQKITSTFFSLLNTNSETGGFLYSNRKSSRRVRILKDAVPLSSAYFDVNTVRCT